MNDSPSRRNRVAALVRDLPRSGIRDFFEIVSTRKDVISLSIGEPDFATPWQIREASIFALDHGATSYTPNRGTLKLRRAISAYVEKTFGVTYDPDSEILVTVGVSEALDLAVRAVAEPGVEIAYHEPCYVSYRPVIALARAEPVAVTTVFEDGFRLTAERLEERLSPRTRAVMLNFPTNPTGGTLDRADMEALARVARERDLVVITDEIYSELTYEGERGSIAALPGMKDRTIFLHGLSKAWAMTGFRVGYACGPADLVEAMMKIHQYTMLCAPILSQEAGAEAFNCLDQAEEMRQSYELRRNLVCASLEEMGLPCVRPRGAFYAFPRISEFGLTSKEFALRLLDEEKVACVPGTAFGECGEGFLRCSFATNIDRIREAMARMATFVARLRRKG